MALALVFCMNACDIENEPYIQGAEDEKMILLFEVGDVVGMVDEDAKTVVLDFEAGTDVSNLTPAITISTYATIEPESGVAQDFTNPVYYTVTAMNGTTAQYMVEAVVHDADNEKSILSFVIDGVEGDINEVAKTVSLTMPENTDVTQLVPTIEVSEGATVNPASGEAQDFTTPVTYTVTAQNGTTAAYTVTVYVMGGTLEPTGKTVLIKDFTGARCVNCPEAATYAHNLQHQLDEDHIFIMSVHAGYLAQPMGSFPDFLTDEGTLWYNNHDSNPLFAVDHVALTDGNTLNVNQIDAPVAAALAEEQSFEIQVTPRYEETSRLLNVEVNAVALVNKEGPFSITVCLVEDHIVGWQTTPSGVDREYDFRNVFRGTLNGANGDEFETFGVEADETFRFNYSTDLNADYNADECYLMVYISTGDQILQTAVKKIK
jgi:hypothetical protein